MKGMVPLMQEKPVFRASLDDFEGPLDLMLHLVQENELDLFKLDLFALATQYVRFILSVADLNAASEYMVEFARLLEYKSRKLLPVQDQQEEEQIVQEYSTRLLDYQNYRQASQMLAQTRKKRLLQLEREPDRLVRYWKQTRKEELSKGNVKTLHALFSQLMERSAAQTMPMQLERRDLSAEQIKRDLYGFFHQHPRSPLEKVLLQFDTRAERIVGFLVILEGIQERRLLWDGKELRYESTPTG